MDASNVADILRRQAATQPASPAIIFHNQVITYARLESAVGAAARLFMQHGVAPGKVVAISMGQQPLHLIAMLALARLGAISLPLHVAVPAERRALAARRFGASCVVSGRDDMALPGLTFISLSNLSFDERAADSSVAGQAVDAGTPFRIALSSGTSGDPKGMLITHGLMLSRSQRPEPGLNTRSRVMPMDINFVGGFNEVLRVLAFGACVVFPKSSSPEHWRHAVVAHRVTHVSLSPAQAHELAGQCTDDGLNFPQLVCLRIGGGLLDPALLKRVQSTMNPGVHVIYGSSETGMVTAAGPTILEKHPRSAGPANSWSAVEVVDDDDHPLLHDIVGNIRMRSLDQVPGYYLEEPHARSRFRDGWFYPGDLGKLDQHGLLFVEGRADDQLNVGGQNINPDDIDAVLLGHPGVADAGCFVLQDGKGGSQLAALIVFRAKPSLSEVQAHATARLGPLAPRQYFVASSLPRTGSGKLKRRELAGLASTTERQGRLL